MVSSLKIIRILERDGWFCIKSNRGSHLQFKHPTKKGKVTVKHPDKDVLIGTLLSIEKQSGLKIRKIIENRK